MPHFRVQLDGLNRRIQFLNEFARNITGINVAEKCFDVGRNIVGCSFRVQMNNRYIVNYFPFRFSNSLATPSVCVNTRLYSRNIFSKSLIASNQSADSATSVGTFLNFITFRHAERRDEILNSFGLLGLVTTFSPIDFL